MTFEKVHNRIHTEEGLHLVVLEIAECTKMEI